VPPDKHKWYK